MEIAEEVEHSLFGDVGAKEVGVLDELDLAFDESPGRLGHVASSRLNDTATWGRSSILKLELIMEGKG